MCGKNQIKTLTHMTRTDSCKFLHDRGDYKSGWQMEMEFKEQEKKRQQRLAEGMDPEADNDDNKYVIESSDEDEKDACTICREPFRNAVETLCNHVFCEECALKQYKKKAYCFNCGKPTNGTFIATPIARRNALPACRCLQRRREI